MGLLLGMIMGLSISPTTKIVMGVLAAGLGTFLGFDKSAFKGEDTNDSQAGRKNFLRELRVGSFGFAVVAGIIFGLTIRTNEMFSPTIAESVAKWTEAGYSPAEARQFVALERLRIDPKTGEVREITDADKTRISALFSAEKKITLSELIEAESWAANMDGAISKANALDLVELENLLTAINNNAPPRMHQPVLENLKILAKTIEQGAARACHLAAEPGEWRDQTFAEISSILREIENPGEKSVLADAIKTLLCSLEKNN